MNDSLAHVFTTVFGSVSDLHALTLGHMVARAALIYVIGLAVIRIGRTRLLGRHTGFDIVLGIIVGSMLSRGINGAAPPLATLGAVLSLVLLHWSLSSLAFHSSRFDRILKGRRESLVEDGAIRDETLRRSEISREDLHEALRLVAQIEDPGQVKHAYIERNGRISVVPRNRGAEPRVLDIDVRDGVQTIRLELVR